VLGGLAVRLELTFEQLEDLQLALGMLLECCGDVDEMTIRVRVENGELTATIGPFDAAALADQLDREVDGPNLQRVLETVADRVSFADREDGRYVELTEQIGAVKTDG
jgi:hypothetical protein